MNTLRSMLPISILIMLTCPLSASSKTALACHYGHEIANPSMDENIKESVKAIKNRLELHSLHHALPSDAYITAYRLDATDVASILTQHYNTLANDLFGKKNAQGTTIGYFKAICIANDLKENAKTILRKLPYPRRRALSKDELTKALNLQASVIKNGNIRALMKIGSDIGINI